MGVELLLQGTVEVETGESVNTVEAMSQWALFSRLRAPFVLYVPPSALDTARRLCAEFNIPVSEIWTYHTALDQVRFTMVHHAPEAAAKPEPKPAAPAKAEVKAAKPPAVKPVAAAPAPKVAAAAKTAKPAVKAAPKAKPVAKSAAKKPAAKTAAKPAAKPATKPAPKAKPAAKAAAKAVKGKAKRR